MPERFSNEEKNVKEFMEKYGKEGFLKLFLTNYLYELVMYYIHSSSTKEDEDTGFRFYVNALNKSYSIKEIDQFKKDIRAECSKKADVIIAEIKELGILEELSKDPTSNPKVMELIKKSFEGLIR